MAEAVYLVSCVVLVSMDIVKSCVNEVITAKISIINSIVMTLSIFML